MGLRSLVALLLLAACATPQRFHAERVLMGTKARIVYYAPEGEEGAGRNALDRIAELEAVMSDYRPDSEVMLLCARGGGRVSGDLARVLRASLKASRESGGAFDITIGPLTHAWRKRRQPGPDDFARVGWRHLELSGDMVTLKKRGMILDLGGIGKGFAADEALRELRRHGVTRALVDLGGDIAVGDPPPGERGWRVVVAGETRLLANRAVATSGHAERPGHILDPRTGRTTSLRLRVTVVASTATEADAWASAMMVSGRGAPHPKRLEVLFEGE